MAVYVIQAGDSGPVKIGLAHDVMKRVYTLQTAHHATLRLLRVFPGGKRVERELHQRFRSAHIRGEWFALSAEDVAAITSVETSEPNAPHRALIDALGGVAGLSVALGVAPNTVATWRKRSRISARWWGEVIELARARGIEGVTGKTLRVTSRVPAEAP